MLLASAAAVPVLLSVASCRSTDLFAGPDPLAGRPRPSPDVITLQVVIAAEESMIHLYKTAIGGSGAAGQARALAPLFAQHAQHLAQLRNRLVLPPGQSGPRGVQGDESPPRGFRGDGSLPMGGSGGVVPPRATANAATVQLRSAERASAAELVRQLATAQPVLAQLLASIAASHATHVTALGG
jgi:hypothetical protein